MIPNASEFLKIISKEAPPSFALGLIDASYSSGNPAILFDGETTVSTKTYHFLASYKPVASDRVVLAKIGGSFVILGKFDGTFPASYSMLLGEGTALPATTGTMTAKMDSSYKSITPTGSCTFNATGGTAGQRLSFVITTTGTTSRTLTWSTNFKPAGTLATGTTSGKMFVVNFIYNGSLWVETGRTSAM